MWANQDIDARSDSFFTFVKESWTSDPTGELLSVLVYVGLQLSTN